MEKHTKEKTVFTVSYSFYNRKENKLQRKKKENLK